MYMHACDSSRPNHPLSLLFKAVCARAVCARACVSAYTYFTSGLYGSTFWGSSALLSPQHCELLTELLHSFKETPATPAPSHPPTPPRVREGL